MRNRCFQSNKSAILCEIFDNEVDQCPDGGQQALARRINSDNFARLQLPVIQHGCQGAIVNFLTCQL
ncbi:hypothetical protein D3C87_2123380 [compost metagenome]